jgi:hypothetical protein
MSKTIVCCVAVPMPPATAQVVQQQRDKEITTITESVDP